MLVTEAQALKKMCAQDHAHQCIGSDCMAWKFTNMPESVITRRVYRDSAEYADYMTARFTTHRNDTFFQFDNAWWRYEYSSSDTRGMFDQLVRSVDTNADALAKEEMLGYCGFIPHD